MNDKAKVLANLRGLIAAQRASVKSAAGAPAPTAGSSEGGVGTELTKATLGAVAAEASADIKKDIVNSVDGQGKGDVAGDGRGENTPVLSIGGNVVAPTGEDPAAENPKKDTPDDPGTSHPAKVASVSDAIRIGESILADIAVAKSASEAPLVPDTKPTIKEVKPSAELTKVDPEKEKVLDKTASEKTEVTPEVTPEEIMELSKKASEGKDLTDEEQEKLAGFVAASLINEKLSEAGVKTAAYATAQHVIDAKAQALVSDVMVKAARDANNVADYLQAYFTKLAEELPPEALAQLGAMDPAMGGGMDPAAMGGMDPAAMGADPGAGGEAGVSEAEIEALVQALLEAGVSPEEIMALISGGGGGEAAGGAVEEELPAEEQPEAVEEEVPADDAKVASVKKAAMRTAVTAALRAKARRK